MAPPSIRTISFPILAAAAPDCKPGWPVVVVAGVAPAVPLGVGAAENGAGTTVTAVTVLWLPSSRVVVRRIVEVRELEDPAFDDPAPVVAAPPADDSAAEDSLGDVGEASDEGLYVTNPPPIVLTMVTPDTSVVVTIAPGTVTTPPGDEDASGDEDSAVDAGALDCASVLD